MERYSVRCQKHVIITVMDYRRLLLLLLSVYTYRHITPCLAENRFDNDFGQ